MKRIAISAIAVISFLMIRGLSLAEPPRQAKSQTPPAAPHYSSVDYNKALWQKIVPEMGEWSPEITILRVDPKTQATHLLIRNSRKMHIPMHWHNANETHTIMKGMMVFECDGKRDTLGPGSFNAIPARSHHQAWLPDGGLVMITVDAAWDVNWVQGPPTAADVGVEPPRAGAKPAKK